MGSIERVLHFGLKGLLTRGNCGGIDTQANHIVGSCASVA